MLVGDAVFNSDSLRIGPPKTVIGKKSYYRREGVRQWLLRKEQEQARASC